MKTFKNIWFCAAFPILTNWKISRCSVIVITLLSVKAKVGVACWWHFTGTERLGEVNLFDTAPLFIYTRGALQEFETIIDSSKSPLTDGLISFNRWRHWFSAFSVPDFDQHLLNSTTKKRKLIFPWNIEQSPVVLAIICLFWQLCNG